MTQINFQNVFAEYPVFNANGRSIKNQLVRIATGGILGSTQSGKVLVSAITNLTISISDGDRIGVIGHNGAGKTTFLKLLSGIYEPTSGEITRVGRISALTDIGLGIDSEATGRENIFIRGALLGFSKSEMTSKLDDIIEFTELGEFIDLPVRTYSTGMHLRLAFAVATAIDPEILVMDEWLSVGDEQFRYQAEARMASLLARTKVLVIASHSRQLIEATCNRVIWLEHGHLVMDGPANVVLSAYFE